MQGFQIVYIFCIKSCPLDYNSRSNNRTFCVSKMDVFTSSNMSPKEWRQNIDSAYLGCTI